MTKPQHPGMSPHDILAAELARRARELPIEDLARLVMGPAPVRRRRARPASGEFRAAVQDINRPRSEAPPAPAGPTLRELVTNILTANHANPLSSIEIVQRVLATPGHSYREPSIRSEISRQVSEGQAVRIGPKIGGVYRRRAG